jgi:DNA-binding MarR family transcriptional regulator
VPPEPAGPPLSYAITRLARQIRRKLSDLQVHDLTGPDVIAMLTLDHESGLSNAELARRCFVTPQSMNEVVLELERRELLTRAPDPSNQRILRAELTPAGKELLKSWEGRINALEDALLEGFSEAEARRLRKSIEHAAKNLGLPTSTGNGRTS